MKARSIAGRAGLLTGLVAGLVLLIGAPGCRDDGAAQGPSAEQVAPAGSAGAAEGAGEPEAQDRAAAPAQAAQQAERALETTTFVAVAPEGTTFEPPIEADRLPPGAWYCGTDVIHYAVLDEGQGTCAVCKMPLRQQDGRAASSR